MLWFALVSSVACVSSAKTPEATEASPIQPPTPEPTSIPSPATAFPLGSQINPLTVLLAGPGGRREAEARLQELADRLESSTGMVVEVDWADSYGEAYQALCEGRAQVVTLSAFGYLAASEAGCGEALYVLEQEGKIATQSQFIALTAAEIHRIEGFRNVTVCRSEALSASGWIVPSLAMRAHGIDPASDLRMVIDLEDDEAVILAVYQATCLVGITSVGAEAAVLPSLRFPASVRVLDEAPLPPIPNDVIVLSTRIDESLRARLIDALTPEREALATLLGADALVELEGDPFAGLRDLMNDAGIKIVALAE